MKKKIEKNRNLFSRLSHLKKFAEFIFAIGHFWEKFAEFNFAILREIRENKFRENFFRENFFNEKFFPLIR